MNISFLRMASIMALTVLLGVGCSDDKKDDLDEGKKSSSERPLTAPEGVVAVDLGLTVKWASCNVGATKPEEYGDYYAWGDTALYYKAGFAQEMQQTHWKEEGYFWSTYKWCNGSDDKLTKYCSINNYGNNGFTDSKTTLDPEDDAAYYKWGGQWRMPTKGEMDDLINMCTWKWYPEDNTEFNGVAGYKVTSNVDGFEDKFIFLPAAGYRFEKNITNLGTNGYYWSRSLITDNPNKAYGIGFISGSQSVNKTYSRCYGRTIRPVCP